MVNTVQFHIPLLAASWSGFSIASVFASTVYG